MTERPETRRTLGKLPKVLFIAGAFRSGSTILDAILGGVSGFYAVGELRSLWENGFCRGYLCTCGEPVEDCDFWRRVQLRTFAPQAPPSPARLVALQHRNVRTRPRQLVSLWRQATGRSSASQARSYVETMTRLYSALHVETGADVIVDSSKVPADAYALASFSALEMYVVHIVRDPRAVAHSWSRRKFAPRKLSGGEETRGLLPQWGVLRASAQWLTWNLIAETMVEPRVRGRYLLLRYEDLVTAPAEAVARICHFIGEPHTRSPFIDERTVRLPRRHGVPGNPDRAVGEVEVRPDEEWVAAFSKRKSLLVTLATLPLLRRYRYSLLRFGAPRPVRTT